MVINFHAAMLAAACLGPCPLKSFLSSFEHLLACRQSKVMGDLLALMHAKGTHQTSLMALASCLVACAESCQHFHELKEAQGVFPALDSSRNACALWLRKLPLQTALRTTTYYLLWPGCSSIHTSDIQALPSRSFAIMHLLLLHGLICL